jgi:hypothetical protein
MSDCPQFEPFSVHSILVFASIASQRPCKLKISFKNRNINLVVEIFTLWYGFHPVIAVESFDWRPLIALVIFLFSDWNRPAIAEKRQIVISHFEHKIN